MLFGDKKGSNLSREHINFLNTVDAEYMKAYNTKTVRGIQQYVTRDCCVKIQRIILTCGNRYFGAPKFRNTEWVLLDTNDSAVRVRKCVTFDKIKVAGSLRIDAANSYEEIWTFDCRGKLVVTDIAC